MISILRLTYLIKANKDLIVIFTNYSRQNRFNVPQKSRNYLTALRNCNLDGVHLKKNCRPSAFYLQNFISIYSKVSFFLLCIFSRLHIWCPRKTFHDFCLGINTLRAKKVNKVSLLLSKYSRKDIKPPFSRSLLPLTCRHT